MAEADSLASRLVEADPDEQRRLLHTAAAGGESQFRALAFALKQIYDDSFAADPARAASASAVLDTAASLVDDAVVHGTAAWTAGLVSMDEGRLSDASDRLDAAAKIFTAAGLTDKVASVQIGRMPVLAIQGRFDEALAAGIYARAHCEATGDLLTAGKVEQNLGNLHLMRHGYVEAEEYYRLARARFAQIGDDGQLAQIDNCLATTLTSQHRFSEAEAIYESAMQRAEASRLEVTLAQIECNVGCLALYQGRYGRALEFLERSRRRYAQIGMPHELAIADQELADAYLELNLVSEAAAIYERVTPIFAQLNMPIEQARALAYHGRACVALRQPERATQLLEEARRLYAEVGMPIGEALTQLTQAEIYIQQGDLAAAAAVLARAEPEFAAAHAEGWRLQAQWLQAVVARQMGQLDEAERILDATMEQAQRTRVIQLSQRCASEQGLVALAKGDSAAAEAAFRHSVDLIETLRAPLPAEEFRMGFIGDKLTPYAELVRLCVADGTPDRLAEALSFVERSRARALVDLLGRADQLLQPRDAFEDELVDRLDRLRNELNWFYSQLNRPGGSPGERGYAQVDALHEEARQRETAILTVMRQIQQRQGGTAIRDSTLDVAELQRDLGDETALIEYFYIDDNLLAFVITGDGLDVVDLACTEADVQATLQQFHFQLGSLRHGGAHLQRHLPALIQRVQRPLAELYDLLLLPAMDMVAGRRLVIAPHQSLHYVPFHALYDGERYVVEAREVSVTPSATLLHHCLTATVPEPLRALLVGMSDERAPLVAHEVATLAPLFDQSIVLMGEDATRDNLQQHAADADLVHIACHGRFRNDNPFFSALQLADGWMTVHDAYELRLRPLLVTLSACETGISAVAPGDDLVGLARGFLLAGAPSLLVSLWMVEDAATADLMAIFYGNLLAGLRPAAALRQAQCALLARQSHPFVWAPFVLIGRW